MNKFFFIDLETTGLDSRECKILEVAAIITDNKLNTLEEFTAPIKVGKEDLAAMDTWCRTTHTQSRLLEDIEKSGLLLSDVEQSLQRLKRKHFPVSKPPLSGSSVHFDKRFIDDHMKSFSKELSHRIIDVSSFMAALDNYYAFKLPTQPQPSHRALDDIRQSIWYLKAYLQNWGTL